MGNKQRIFFSLKPLKMNKKIIVFIFPLILIIVGIACLIVYQNSELERVKNHTYAILCESENSQIKTLQAKITGSLSIVTTFANMLAEQDFIDYDTIIRQMKAVIQASDYRYIVIADSSGNAFSQDGRRLNIADREYFQRAMSGEQLLQRVENDKITDTVKIIVAAPLVKDGEIVGAVCAAYDEAIFRELLIPQAYNGDSYTFISRTNGEIIIGSDDSSYTLKENNLLTVLRMAEFNDGMTFAKLTEDMQQRQPGVTVFTLSNGEKRYAAYQSSGFQDWIMFNVLPGEIVEAQINKAFINYCLLLIILLMVFVGIAIFLFIIANRQVKYIELEDDYRKQLMLYRTSKNGGVFSVVVDNDFTLLYGNDKYYEIHEYTPREMKEELANKCARYILPADLAKVRASVKQAVSDGSNYVDFIMRIKTRTGKIKYIWSGALIVKSTDKIVLNGNIADVTAQKQTEIALNKERQSLQISEERFRIALENTKLSIWEYDFATKRITQSIKSQNIHGFDHFIDNVPDSLISRGYIHPDSISDIKKLYRKLHEGNKKVEGIFKIVNESGTEFSYEQIRYTVIFDSYNQPYKAIGISDDVTEKMNILQKYQMETSLRHTINKNIYSTAVINLNENKIETLESLDADFQRQANNITVEEFIAYLGDKIINNENIKEQVRTINARILLNYFAEGTDTLQYKYLRLMNDSTSKWMLLKIHIAHNPLKKCVDAFFSLQDIDSEQRRKNELKLKANTDPLTGIYNLNYAKQAINQYIDNKGKNELNAFLMIDLDSFKQVNDNMGHSIGDKVLVRMADILIKNIKETDIAARIGGDEFIIFLKNIESVKKAVAQAEKLVKELQHTVSKADKSIEITASIGLIICENANKDYDRLYQDADRALYKAKEKGKNQVLLVN